MSRSGLPASCPQTSDPTASTHLPVLRDRFLSPRSQRLGCPLSRFRLHRSYAGWPALDGRIEFVILRLGRSPPTALHHVLRRRSCLQLQAGGLGSERTYTSLSGFHLQAHVGARGARPAIQSGSLGSFIGGFKSITTKRINEIRGTPDTPVWQRNYDEHIIDNDEELQRARQYIKDNPRNWQP
jgi:hypothetical protein